ncbi:HD domain-containing phosphohydrolase [Thermodesulfobacteriota bacterium]
MNNVLPKQTLLVVDDTPENIDILDGILRKDYKIKVALNGKKALEIGFKNQPDLILLDIMMPGMDGYEVCRRLKENNDTKKIPIIFVTAKGEIEDEARGFKLGAADYITKPVNPVIVRERVKTHLALYDQNRVLEEKVQERTAQLGKAFETIKNASLDTIHRLSRAAEYKDEDTGAHLFRMSNYCAAVARKMRLNKTSVESLLYAAPMHDIGKIGIPDRILLKPGKLDSDEWMIMKQHTTFGAAILEGADKGFIKLGEVIAITHHEKWDGSGYPRGLKGREIPLIGRIVAVSDVFDALTSKRPYKEPFSLEKSFDIIRESRGNHFDPDVVDAFLHAKDELLDIKEKYKDE